MSSNPGRVDLGVFGTSVLRCTLIKNIIMLDLFFAYNHSKPTQTHMGEFVDAIRNQKIQSEEFIISGKD